MVKWFEELSAVNVNEHIKQKNGLNYLSWMWAWQELKKKFPLSYATVHETEDGMLVWRDPIGWQGKRGRRPAGRGLYLGKVSQFQWAGICCKLHEDHRHGGVRVASCGAMGVY